jgi:6-phosphogluconolactonase
VAGRVTVVPRPAVIAFDDAQAFAEGAAAALIDEVTRSMAARGHCRLAIPGGRTPGDVYSRLAQGGPAARLDWARLDLFWTDERAVPPHDDASNYRLAFDAWLRHVSPPPSRIHRIEAERPPDEAARRYAAALGSEPLDLVVLGMGGDGHTASLFPETIDSLPPAAAVVVTHAPVPPHTRISLSLATINAARMVHFWVTGSDKRARLAQVFDEVERGRPTLPASRVRPVAGAVRWFVDRAAAQDLAAEGGHL